MLSLTQIKITKPTWQDIEKSIINILRAGIYYRKLKDKGFMSWYKKQLDELRKSEDPECHIFEKALEKFPNEELYKTTIEEHNTYYKKELRIQQSIAKYYNLYYNMVKDTFNTEKEMEEELDAFINS